MGKANRIIKGMYLRGYRVINNSLYNPKGKELTPSKNGGTNPARYYIYKGVYKEESCTFMLHRLVAYQKYKNKVFEEGVVVRHLDGNSLNNSEDNIYLGSPSDNMMDRLEVDRVKHAKHASSFNRRFTDVEVKEIRKDRKRGMKYLDLCEKYNTSKSTLSFLFNKATY